MPSMPSLQPQFALSVHLHAGELMDILPFPEFPRLTGPRKAALRSLGVSISLSSRGPACRQQVRIKDKTGKTIPQARKTPNLRDNLSAVRKT